MIYSFDDQHTILAKKTSYPQLSAIDYFQFNFNDIQFYNCWKLILNSNSNSPFIPQSTNIKRLENLIWRKWVKTNLNLKECNPEKVNWYKESDITWLYGPLVLNEENLSKFNKDRNDSFSSLSSSTSSMNSYNYNEDSESEIESDSEVFIDDEFELLSIKSILKNTNTNKLFDLNKKKLIEKRKSVSFAEMVQIRQFY